MRTVEEKKEESRLTGRRTTRRTVRLAISNASPAALWPSAIERAARTVPAWAMIVVSPCTSAAMLNNQPGSKSWVEAELEDSFDEELEMEIDDLRVGEELRHLTDQRSPSAIAAAPPLRSIHCRNPSPAWRSSAKRPITRTAAAGAAFAGRRRAFSPKWMRSSPT